MGKKIKLGYKLQVNPSSNVLFILLSGRGHWTKRKRFEFNKSVASFDVNKIFLMDKGYWYLDGVPGIDGGFWGLLEQIRQWVVDMGIQSVVTFGASSGGFGAILVGLILSSKEVYAFSPQISMNPDVLLRLRDKRWGPSLFAWFSKNVEGIGDELLLDVRNFLSTKIQTAITIYYPSKCAVDVRHVELLAGFDQVRAVPISTNVHNVAKVMKESGQLDKLFNNVYRSLS